MSHIAVIAEFELGSHKAHAINVVKTAGGFARLGHTVTLFCRPPRWGRFEGFDPSELLAQYGEPSLRCEFQLFKTTSDEAGSKMTGEWAARRAAELGVDVVYARHNAGAHASAALGLRTVLETHAYVGAVSEALDEALAATRDPARSMAVVTISPRLRNYYIERGGDPGKIHIVADGVDLDLFRPPAVLPPNPYDAPGAHAVYTGNLYDYNGIPTILEAAACSLAAGSTNPVCYDLVGGSHEDETRVRAAVAFQGLTNTKVHGHVLHTEVGRYLWHADVLLLPLAANGPTANWASPVKLGEYLASGKPIVASAIPGLKDWVDAPAVRWFEPDNARALAAAIEASLTETSAQGAARRQIAAELAREYCYPNRAKRILEAAETASAKSIGSRAMSTELSQLPKAA
jgi:glycosyltransferase involved in cell wall biosynthesis